MLERAKLLLPEFETALFQMRKFALLNGRSESTIRSYSSSMARIILDIRCMPEKLSKEELQNYLYRLAEHDRLHMQTILKLAVFALRFYFKATGNIVYYLILPSVKHEKRLPMVLSESEIRRFLLSIDNFKHRVMMATLYGLGLRVGELVRLKWEDVCFDRNQVLIRKTKSRRNRAMPLGKSLRKVLKIHVKTRQSEYVFANEINNLPLTPSAVRYIIAKTTSKMKFSKSIYPHVFRHSYATHLLEMGLDIFSLMNLLGHARIDQTLTYLHLSRLQARRAFSPLDVILGAKKRLVVMS